MNGQHITMLGPLSVTEIVQVEVITMETCSTNASQYADLVQTYRQLGYSLRESQDYARQDMTLFI